MLQQYKVNLANNAVLESNGNKTLAAKKLRISRAYLHRLIRQAPEEPIAFPPTNLALFRAASAAS